MCVCVGGGGGSWGLGLRLLPQQTIDHIFHRDGDAFWVGVAFKC